MAKHDANGSVTQRGILESVDGDDSAVDALITTDATYPETRHAEDRRRASTEKLPKEVIVSVPGSDTYTEYTFEVTGDLRKLEPDEDSGRAVDEVTNLGDRVRVEGTVGTGDDRFAFSGDLDEVAVPSGVQLDIRNRTRQKRDQGRNDWRKGYRKYAQEYVPTFYEAVASKRNLYRCVRYVAKTTNFWETLGKKMYLDRAVVTAAYAYPLPNYKQVDKKAWDGILGDMYADMPDQYKKPRKYPVAVPVVVVYLYDGYYNAVAYLRPYGKSYKSYGYAIESGYHRRRGYDSLSDYESNTWWWTEDGWGDAGDTEGGILDGVPIGLVD